MTRTHVEHAMGTVFSISATADASHASALDQAIVAARAWLHEVDDRFTTYRSSEWLDFVEGRLDLDDAHPDVRHVALRCAELHQVTNGWFDPAADRERPPDPAAFVKGWATQHAATIVAVAADHVLVNGGGDIHVNHRSQPWRIGIQHPLHHDLLVATVELHGGAVATSGSYERGGHIHSPRTHRPTTQLASVTVVGPELGEADAYSTALYACGGDDVEWFAAIDGYAAYLFDADGGARTIGSFAPRAAA